MILILSRNIVLCIFILIILIFSKSAISESASFPSTAPGMPDISSGVQFCNTSKYEYIHIAINHWENGSWYREGWWKIPRGDCMRVLSSIQNQTMYYYAYSGSVEWSGPKKFCTVSSAFRIPKGTCPTDADIYGFKELRLGNHDAFTLTLN